MSKLAGKLDKSMIAATPEVLAEILKQAKQKREPLDVVVKRAVKRSKSAPVPLHILNAEDDDEGGEDDDFLEGDVGEDGSEAMKSDSGDEMESDVDEEDGSDLEEGERHMELLFTDKDLDDEDLGELDTHNLEKERERRTDQHDRSITKTEHEVSCLFYDILSRYALAKREAIIKGKITEALSPADLVELAKAMGVSLSFRKKLKEIKQSIAAMVLKNEEPNTTLAKVVGKMQSATGVHIAPLDGILQLCPALADAKYESVCVDILTQEKILANKGVLVQLRDSAGVVNMIMTKQTLSFALAIYFINHFELIVAQQCCQFMDEILARDRDVMPEAIIMRYIHEDAKQIIPMYSNYFRRQLKRLAISFPELVLPKSILADLNK